MGIVNGFGFRVLLELSHHREDLLIFTEGNPISETICEEPRPKSNVVKILIKDRDLILVRN